MIAVVDAGVNNVRSVLRALAAAGHPGTLTEDPRVVRRADRVVLPGVGHFATVRRTLQTMGLDEAVVDVARAGRPLLGICLGLQLLLEGSDEDPTTPGLGLIPGRVTRFRTDLPVPHVGWSEVRWTAVGAEHPATCAIAGEGPAFFYHVHSYHPDAVPEQTIVADAEYGARFPTVLGRDNVLGAQFHPEKSQQAGIRFLAGFAAWSP